MGIGVFVGLLARCSRSNPCYLIFTPVRMGREFYFLTLMFTPVRMGRVFPDGHPSSDGEGFCCLDLPYHQFRSRLVHRDASELKYKDDDCALSDLTP